MSKKIGLNVILLFLVSGVFCQQQVNWSFTSKKVDDKTYELHLTATIEESWYIYSQTTPEGGPLRTSFDFSKNPIVVFTGKVKENGNMIFYHSDVFDVDVYAYTGKVDFVQRVQLRSKVKTSISGTVEFMACTKEQCLTPEKVKFSIKLQ